MSIFYNFKVDFLEESLISYENKAHKPFILSHPQIAPSAREDVNIA
jgi:hypothetical protein